MRMIIFGASGFIGSALAQHWLRQGHEVLQIGRKPLSALSSPLAASATWDELAADPELAEETAAWVNLSGASLNQRWGRSGKEAILNSRLQTVAAAGDLLHKLRHKPSVIIQASAVGIYGTSLEAVFDESSPVSVSDFPSEVVHRWEAAADAAYSGTGTRVVKLRTGVVLGNGGGAFPTLKLPYSLGFGGPIGSGKQWLSWIMLQDIIRLIDYCIRQTELEGPVNATAPNPVTNEEFGRLLGSVYHRPHWFPVPSFMLKAALGEMSEMALKGQCALPAQALKHKFTFEYPDLLPALEQLKSEK